MVDCYDINNNTIEDSVQQRSAEWTLYNSLSYLIPAIFADTLLGAYGDRNGRKINILLGITGLLVSEYGYLLTLSNSAATPYWTTTVIGVFTGFTGYVAMIPVSCYAYLADISNGPTELTLRSGIFSVLQTTASVLGGLLAGLIHDHIGISTAIDIELAFIALGFIYTLVRIPQIPGLQEIERRIRVTTITSLSSVRKLRGFLGDVVALYKECIYTYRRPRVGHRRAFMFITVIVLMLTYTTQVETRTTGIGSVINNFVFRRTENGALGWDSEDLGYWNGMGYMMLIVGTIFGLVVFKKALDFRETTLILIGIVSSTLRTIIIGVAVSDWMMYVANVVGMFAGLVQPAVVSFMTQVVASSEIGRTLALFGIGVDAAFILTAALYTNVYRWTVIAFLRSDMDAWVYFLLIAALLNNGFLAMLWVYCKQRKESGKRNVAVAESREDFASPMAGRRDRPLWSSHDDVSALRRGLKRTTD
ncbi:unnamed protein product, partial [Mesorhabditis belari]|uniref:Proton-coupled folate transporter n=1 Tax=Mesorhabditis belari TaxID=2138241 RepID=A0AAF3FPD2_9BILA